MIQADQVKGSVPRLIIYDFYIDLFVLFQHVKTVNPSPSYGNLKAFGQKFSLAKLLLKRPYSTLQNTGGSLYHILVSGTAF